MSSRYSLAEARSRLSRLVDEVEQGSAIELTRRGRAFLLDTNVSDFQPLSGLVVENWIGAV